jgi:hypothetical protein
MWIAMLATIVVPRVNCEWTRFPSAEFCTKHHMSGSVFYDSADLVYILIDSRPKFFTFDASIMMDDGTRYTVDLGVWDAEAVSSLHLDAINAFDGAICHPFSFHTTGEYFYCDRKKLLSIHIEKIRVDGESESCLRIRLQFAHLGKNPVEMQICDYGDDIDRVMKAVAKMKEGCNIEKD